MRRAATAVGPLLAPLATAVVGCALIVGCAVLVGCTSSGDTATVTAADARSALRVHARALLGHDRAAFLEGVGTARAATSFRGRQQAQFDNIAAVPLRIWSYAVDSRSSDTGAQRAARQRFGASATVFVLTLRVAVTGADPVAAPHTLWWTFARQGGRVVAVADDALARSGGVSWRGPWDFAPLTVVRARHGVILGHPDNAAFLEALARSVDLAVPTVTSVWGRAWNRYVGVLVPSSAAELAAALDPGSRSRAIVAAATSDGQDPVSGAFYDQRLVVDPDRAKRLSPVGLRIVVQHEITHIADAAKTSDASPNWLVEGFADYVGNLGSGQSVAVTASELRRDVRRGALPRTLPDAEAFRTVATAPAAYEGAWLACRLIAARAGRAGLVRFYGLVGASPLTSDAAVAGALRTVLHETPSAFVTRWRAYLRSELGR